MTTQEGKTMKNHYHVNQFQPGCLNDSDSGPYTNRRIAEQVAAQDARDYRDAGCYVTGNARNGGYWIQHSKDSYGGWRLAVEDCDNPECLDDEYQY